MASDLSQFHWEAVALRLTAFPEPHIEIDSGKWWELVVGNPPEQRVEQPRAGQIVELSTLGNGRLELQVNPVSLTWIHQKNESHPEIGGGALGEFRSVREEFCALIGKWFELDSVPNLTRLAFGAVLIQPVRDREEGLERLDKYLSAVTLDPAHSTDFSYQINRRRASKLDIKGLAINRLTKWSVTHYQSLMLHPEGSGFQTVAPTENYVRLDIDINTIPEFSGEFQRSLLPSVFGELVELGIEIAAKGDVP